MTDQVLDILKLVLLALLYLFFARVLWAVWSEVKPPPELRREFQPAGPVPPPSPTPAAGIATEGRRSPRPARGRGGTPRRLVVIEPRERKGTAFSIDGTVSIGREADNTVVITDDSYISAHHARVSLADGHVVVDDLGSRNGTYLNGTRLTRRHTVQVGDRLQVGYTVLEAQ